MQSSNEQKLEAALEKTEIDSAETLKAVNGLMKIIRKLNSAARTGNLRNLNSAIESADKAMTVLREQFTNTKEGWRFNTDHHFENGLFSAEILAMGKRMGVDIMERDGRLYCYPTSVRISAKDKAVFVNKKREGRVRPTVLVSRLKELQQAKPMFKAEVFLEALFKGYSKVVGARENVTMKSASVVPLRDIYELFTLLPGSEKEYTIMEFARDIYSLHRSGTDTVKNGARVSFPASTGTKTSRDLVAITETGQERIYYGICFTINERVGE